MIATGSTSSRTYSQRLLGRLFLASLLLGTYAIVLLAGGHEVSPVGLILVRGDAEAFQPGQVFGWLGVALLVASVLHPRGFRLVAPPAMFCLSISTGAFVSVSEVWIFTAATAIPFAGAALAAGGCLLRKPQRMMGTTTS